MTAGQLRAIHEAITDATSTIIEVGFKQRSVLAVLRTMKIDIEEALIVAEAEADDEAR